MPHHTTQNIPSRVEIGNLAPDHFAVLGQAIFTILSTDLATQTFAQVVDGVPTRDVHREYYGYRRKDFNNNLNPSQPALQAIQSYRRNFRVRSLQMDAKTAQAYQHTTRGSREFNFRLLEVLAVTCHNIAVQLYTQFGGGLRKPEPEEIHQQITIPEFPAGIKPAPVKPKPAELFHPSYQNWEQYPHGLADIVGYWTEYRLFGGVVLFDRGESGSLCNDAFVHPIGRYQIFQLSDPQVQKYVDFLLLSDVVSGCEDIRFQAEKYARRVDPYDAMNLHIYRDQYERKIPNIRPVQCVGRGEDIPGYEESLKELAKSCGRS